AVRRKSYSVVLFDEIEKAHPEVFNMLLQILDEGRLTDAKGRRVDFRNTVIVMTSNVGADLIKRDTVTGFKVTRDEQKSREQQYERMKEKVMTELKNLFRPEFLNRLDATVVFHALSREQIRQIVDIQLASVEKRLLEQNITLDVTNEAKDWLAAKGYDETFGARPLRRVIQNTIEDRLSEALLTGEISRGDHVRVVVENDDIAFKTGALAETT
ncbi:MAG: AAA family ATPase, partial [Dehalococcoidia bacterium]|nr:AAA family ATPase [Dehalococcoidia bacterium]